MHIFHINMINKKLRERVYGRARFDDEKNVMSNKKKRDIL